MKKVSELKHMQLKKKGLTKVEDLDLELERSMLDVKVKEENLAHQLMTRVN